MSYHAAFMCSEHSLWGLVINEAKSLPSWHLQCIAGKPAIASKPEWDLLWRIHHGDGAPLKHQSQRNFNLPNKVSQKDKTYDQESHPHTYKLTVKERAQFYLENAE